MSTDEVRKKLKSKAIGLLARREYSRKELTDKLQVKCMPESSGETSKEELVESVLLELESKGLQSDMRFSESFVRSRQCQGKGPSRIRQELSMKGISGEVLEAAMVDISSTASEDVKRVYANKYRNVPVKDQKDKARRLRFLVSRGFSPSLIYPLLSQD